EQLLPEPTTERITEAIAQYRTRFTTQGIFENTLYKGIPEALTQLISQGVTLHLATSKPHIYAQQILEHFDLARYFTSVNSSELDGTRANKAELIAYILDQVDRGKNMTIGTKVETKEYHYDQFRLAISDFQQQLC
ncbi:MAG: HAD hydrolase-like protein, partial [Cyanobacteria bacterium J06555_13]